MGSELSSASPRERINELLEMYGAKSCAAAHMLCDRYDPDALAYRIVRADGGVDDLTYGALKEGSERFASALSSLGVRSGDRVATLMGKSRNYLIALMGIWRLGAVHVPLFTAFAPPAIAFRLIGSNAKVVVCDAAQAPKLAPSSDMPDAPSWQVISTGHAPGSGLSFEALMAHALAGMAPAALGGDAPIIHIYTSEIGRAHV